MEHLDFNLLLALDALLSETSVTRAAKRLGLSASAMSRTLARLRTTLDDPLLVRAGRELVPTPRAAGLREEVHELAHRVRATLSPRGDLDLALLQRTFTLRANEGFIELFAARLIDEVVKEAPLVRLRFAPKPGKDAGPLRTGQIDLEIGVLGTSAPEVRTQGLFHARYFGVVRSGHPLLDAPVTPESYASCKHVVASRKGHYSGPVDEALAGLGLTRDVVAVVPGFRDAMHIARQSDLVALVPRMRPDAGSPYADLGTSGLVSFDLPVRTTDIVISAMWHPRMQADPAHRWLRNIVSRVCRDGRM